MLVDVGTTVAPGASGVKATVARVVTVVLAVARPVPVVLAATVLPVVLATTPVPVGMVLLLVPALVLVPLAVPVARSKQAPVRGLIRSGSQSIIFGAHSSGCGGRYSPYL